MCVCVLPCLRYRLFGVLLREEASFHDVHEPGGRLLHHHPLCRLINSLRGPGAMWGSAPRARSCTRTHSAAAAPPRAATVAGQLTSRLTSDCYAITRCIATNVNVALRNLLQVIGAVPN
jgi:hypothetical protein